MNRFVFLSCKDCICRNSWNSNLMQRHNKLQFTHSIYARIRMPGIGATLFSHIGLLRAAIIFSFGLRSPIDKHLSAAAPKLHARGERLGVCSFVNGLQTIFCLNAESATNKSMFGGNSIKKILDAVKIIFSNIL